jgi:signal transduction histidine kinase
MNRPYEALPYLYKRREYFESRNSPATNTYEYFAEAYAMLQQVDSAEYYISKTMDMPVKTDETKQFLYRACSLLESSKGDYRNALEIYRQYYHLSDSIAKAKKTLDIARIKNWHELEQKDIENELLQQEQQKQNRLILILAIAMGLIFVFLALSFYFYNKSSGKNKKLQQLHTVKDKLFSVISHDLRSPLSTLLSTLNLYSNNLLDTETQNQLLDDISKRVDDTFSLIENLLRWSKNQMQGIVPSPANFDIQEEAISVLNNLQNIATEKKITLRNYIGNHQVFADRDMFSVILRNLTMNAIKYTNSEGTITLNSELSDNKLIISVKDTGTGMSQDIQNKLFKLSETKSQRGTNNESGTGLGLVLCADFVKINGGDIWFTSKEGEGSTFYFSLPISEP